MEKNEFFFNEMEISIFGTPRNIEVFTRRNETLWDAVKVFFDFSPHSKCNSLAKWLFWYTILSK